MSQTRRKQKFNRQEYFRYKKVHNRWRRPSGRHSKMRQDIGGKMISPTIGWGTDAKVRGLHPCGLEDVLVDNVHELDKIDKGTQAVRISGRIGKRKRRIVEEKARSLELKILNQKTLEAD
jgi:large subunit ribosomal protein L32e